MRTVEPDRASKKCSIRLVQCSAAVEYRLIRGCLPRANGSAKIRHRCDSRPVERGNLLHVELEALDVLVEVDRVGFGMAGGGASAAAGVYASPSAGSSPSADRSSANPSLWPLPAISYTSIVRLPSVSTCLPENVSKSPSSWTASSLSGLSVCGAAHACS